jgi:hypothetical protein
MKKRRAIAQELMTTEKNYVQALKNIVDLYMNQIKVLSLPFTFQSGNSPKIPDESYKVMFFGIEVIYAYNSLFLEQMEKEMRDFNPITSKLGPSFLMIVCFCFFDISRQIF